MNDIFFLNDSSLPAPDKGSAEKYMTAIYQGVINLTEENYPVLFCDNDLSTLQLSSDYLYSDYRLSVAESNIDFAEFILNIEEKSPLVDYIDDFDLNEIVDSKVYIYETPFENSCIKYSCIHDIILLSFPTADFWKTNNLPYKIRSQKGIRQDGILRNIFDENIDSLRQIKEKQFSLADKSKFQRTNSIYYPTKQRVYREIRTGYYWYFDVYHKNHYEVFDENDNHLGEASLEGVIDSSKADPSRSIRSLIN